MFHFCVFAAPRLKDSFSSESSIIKHSQETVPSSIHFCDRIGTRPLLYKSHFVIFFLCKRSPDEPLEFGSVGSVKIIPSSTLTNKRVPLSGCPLVSYSAINVQRFTLRILNHATIITLLHLYKTLNLHMSMFMCMYNDFQIYFTLRYEHYIRSKIQPNSHSK